MLKNGGTGGERTGLCSIAELFVCNYVAIICLPGGVTDRWEIVEDGDELEKKADDDEEQDEVEVLGEAVEGIVIDEDTVADSFVAAVVLVAETIGLSKVVVVVEVEDMVREVVVAKKELSLALLFLMLSFLLLLVLSGSVK